MNVKNTWIGEEYSPLLIDKINVMLEKEESSPNCHDYLNTPAHSPHLDTIDERWRQKTAEWMFKVIDFYDLERDIVNTAMTYFDRMLSVSMLHHRISKDQCCLLSMACLKLAVKVSTLMNASVFLSQKQSLTSYISYIQLLEPRIFNMADMIKLGCRPFTPKQLVLMEHEILFGLQWDVLPPTTFEFAHHMICMLPSDVPKPTRYVIQELSKYMSELAICVYKLVGKKPSVKALAIVSVAIDSLDADSAISTEAQCTFALRIYDTFQLWYHDNEEIAMLKEELNNLICHNTNLREFVKLIRATHKEEEVNSSGSPKSTAVNVFVSS